jgi:Outer membrane protein beta-barrel domain
MRRHFTTALVLLCAAPLLHAADNGIYLGAALGQGQLRPNLGNINYDDRNQGYKLIAGVRPLDTLGFEVNYIDFGKTRGQQDPNIPTLVAIGPVAATARLYDMFVVGYFPLPLVDLFGKAGLARGDYKFDAPPNAVLRQKDNTFAWGLGLQARFGSLAARAEYERFDIRNTSDVNMFSLGLTWTFL